MTIDAVVALKTRSESKRRLSAVLSDEQRCGLVEAMAQDVLSCLMTHPEIDTVHAVCGEGWTRSAFPEGSLMVWEEGESRGRSARLLWREKKKKTGSARIGPRGRRISRAGRTCALDMPT